jgi:hypothetical protein
MTTSGEVWRIDGEKAVQVAGSRSGRSHRDRVQDLAGRAAHRAGHADQRDREVGLLRIEHGASFVVNGWRSVPLLQESTPIAGAVDVGWSSTTSLTVLAGVGRPADVVEVDIDGVVLHDDGRSDTWSATSLAASARGSRKAVGDSTGAVWLYQDSFRWNRLPGKLTIPSYPG